MGLTVRYSAAAVEDLRRLRKFDQTGILDLVGTVLGVNPTLESKARIKRLRQPAPSQFRMRIGEFRVFYDVEADTVNVLRVLSRETAGQYLKGE